MSKKKQSSLESKHQDVLRATKPRRSNRVRLPVIRAGFMAEEDVIQSLKNEGIIDPTILDTDVDDTDYLQAIGGRPAQFTTTWETTYGSRTLMGSLYRVVCQEGGSCRGGTIYMNSKGVELNGGSTPKGKPRKPPVCHIVPWVALEAQMLERESRATNLAGGHSRKYTDHFRRSVCWYQQNLRTGHNACNSEGEKAKVSSLTKKEQDDASTIIDKVANEFTSRNEAVWMR